VTAEARIKRHDAPDQNDPATVLALIGWIDNKLSAATSALYRERFGIGITERRVLLELTRNNDLGITRLCEIIGADKSSISRAVNQLEKLGLVETQISQRDKRNKIVGATAQGMRLTRRINQVSDLRDAFLNDFFTKDEAITLRALLVRLHENVPAIVAYRPNLSDFASSQPRPR